MNRSHSLLNLILVAIISFLCSFCQFNNDNLSLEGNWSMIKECDSKNMYLEMHIGEGTLNVFASDVKDVVLSSYYKIDGDNIYLLSDDKRNTEDTISFQLDKDFIELALSDSLRATYKRYTDGVTLENYFTKDEISKSEYLNDFYERLQNFKDSPCR